MTDHLFALAAGVAEINRAHRKMAACVRLARHSSHDALTSAPGLMRALFRTIRDEAMQDARYWRNQITTPTTTTRSDTPCL